MNIKEAFRYQKFLDHKMTCAGYSIKNSSHAMVVTETHKRHDVNPDVDDRVEVRESEEEFTPVDDVIDFMYWLVGEKEKLSEAIDNAKHSVGFDLDAAIESNKYRQNVNMFVKSLLQIKPYKKKSRGTDYKFNVEGNQTPYTYEIEVVAEDAYDRAKAKNIAQKLIAEADKVSSEIDSAIVNTDVEYTPPFDVNESYEDIVAEFASNKEKYMSM